MSPDVVAYAVTWAVLAGYAVVLFRNTRKFGRFVERAEAVLESRGDSNAIHVQAWELVAENDRLRTELTSKDHHLAAMQARIDGLEGRRPS